MGNCPCCSPPWAMEANLGFTCAPAVRVSLGCTGTPNTDLCGTVASCTYESAPRSPQRIYRANGDALGVARKYTAQRLSGQSWEVKAYFGGRTISPTVSYVHVGTYRGLWSGTGSATLSKHWDILDPADDDATQSADFHTAVANLHWWTAGCDEESESARLAFGVNTTQVHKSRWVWNGSSWLKWIDAPSGYTQLESVFAPVDDGTTTGQTHDIPWSGLWTGRADLPATITITALTGAEAPENPACQYVFADDGCTGTVEWQEDLVDFSVWPPGPLESTRWHSGLDYANTTLGSGTGTNAWIRHGGDWYHNRIPSGLGNNFEEPVAASENWHKFVGSWDSVTAYAKREVVEYAGSLYFATAAIAAGGGAPSGGGSWSTTGQNYPHSVKVPVVNSTPAVDPCSAPCRARPAQSVTFVPGATARTTPCDNPRIVYTGT